MEYGKHCSYKECNSLDFLPVECQLCKTTFCASHGRPDQHDCLHQKRFVDRSVKCEFCGDLLPPGPEDPNVDSPELKLHQAKRCEEARGKYGGPVCALESCAQSVKFVRAHCALCDQDYCLKHRHPDEHACPKPQATEASTTKADTGAGKKAVKPRPVIKLKKRHPKVVVMKLKMKAKGNNNVPQEKRVYYDVAYVASDTDATKLKHMPLFFNQDDVFGRILDQAATQFGVTNTNNASEAQRLQLLSVESNFDTLPNDVTPKANGPDSGSRIVLCRGPVTDISDTALAACGNL
eukprot:Clim_evm52s153 gene=Clim_evmTU52s153